jgi:hypothetical protein
VERMLRALQNLRDPLENLAEAGATFEAVL